MTNLRTLIITICILIPASILAQPFEDISSGITGLGRSYVAWGDYDKDGDLDVAVCGITPSGDHLTLIYRNDEGVFTDIEAGLTGVKDGSLEWGDYDNDEDLDLLVTGETQTTGSNISLIYENNEGIFEAYDAGFTAVGYGHGAWGDFDGDGDLDVLITGSWVVELYENDEGIFTLLNHDFGVLQNSKASWGDFDNDGDLDLLLIGDTGGGYISRVFKNEDGNFIYIDLGMVGVFSGTADWIDYDKDGDMDISITGFDIYLEPVFLLYTNNGDGTVDSLSHYMEGIATSSVDWGDYDNDGDLDVLMSGKTGCCGGNTTKIFRNDTNGFNIEANADISGSIRSGLAWADYDNDGDLDFLLTGMTPDEVPYSKMILNAAGTNNFVTNTASTSPANLISLIDGNSVMLSWDKATDDQTPQDGLNYNLRIGGHPGEADMLTPMASVSSGFRFVQALGNTNSETSKTITNLPQGTYYWSVQAIDQAYSGSAFAEEQSFTILETGINDVAEENTFRVYPNPAIDKLFLQSTTSKKIVYHIYNISGQEIMKGEGVSGFSVDISPLTEGMYFIRCQSDSESTVLRVIKQ